MKGLAGPEGLLGQDNGASGAPGWLAGHALGPEQWAQGEGSLGGAEALQRLETPCSTETASLCDDQWKRKITGWVWARGRRGGGSG